MRGAPPGAAVYVAPSGRSKTGITARRLSMVRPPPDAQEPRCAQFGLCGGCTLQELSLDAQRAAKHAFAVAEVEAGYGPLDGVVVHPVRGEARAYGYRNKVELAFGGRRYLSEEAHQRGEPIEGRFLGFHAPGRFDRVVDAPRCELVSEEANTVLAAARAVFERPGSPAPWDPREHVGFWRHLVLREGSGGRIAVLFTTSADGGRAWAEQVEEALRGLVVGFQWRTNDGVADVAKGDLAWSTGEDAIEERLGARRFRLSASAFFQTNTAGAEVLYETIGELLGRGGVLVDLYCGVGSIGIFLADRFERVVGIEENPDSVVDARANAERNGVTAELHAAKVEDALASWTGLEGAHLVLDPPRAGLHPKVAAAVAARSWASLVYVACEPASLGRDGAVLRAAGYALTDLHVVDLFPQTGHVEAVARFARTAVSAP